jgi:RNA polymerase sigma factor (sigma-70 family)
MYAANTALAGLYQTYARELHGFARRRVGRQEAEDVVQDTYLHLLQRGTAATLEHPRPYLYRIAANLAVDFARKTKVAVLERGRRIFLQRRRSALSRVCRRKHARIAAAASHP